MVLRWPRVERWRSARSHDPIKVVIHLHVLPGAEVKIFEGTDTCLKTDPGGHGDVVDGDAAGGRPVFAVGFEDEGHSLCYRTFD